MAAELEKLETNLGGVDDMKRLPDAIFVVDLKKEQLAIREARRLNLPVVALVDTNCDPDDADYVIPGNDDAIRSCSLIIRAIANGIEAGKQKVTATEMTAPTNGQPEKKDPEAAAEEAPAEEAQPEPAAEAAPAEPAAEEAPAEPAAEAAATEQPVAEEVPAE
jgi:small subunit ribosomal protein S2